MAIGSTIKKVKAKIKLDTKTALLNVISYHNVISSYHITLKEDPEFIFLNRETKIKWRNSLPIPPEEYLLKNLCDQESIFLK